MAHSISKCPISLTDLSSDGTIATPSNLQSDTKQNLNDEQQLNQHEVLSKSSIFPFERSLATEPPVEYNQLRAEQSIYRTRLSNGHPVCLISRFGDVCLVLGDNEHFSKVQNAEDLINNNSNHGQFLNMDSTKYFIYRQIIEKEFSIDRIKEYEPKMQMIVEHLLTELINQNSPIDFVSEFALKVPSFILYHLIGINNMDYQFLNSRTQFNINSNSKLNEDQISRKELLDYIHRLIDQKKQTPQSDIISRLIIEQFRPGRINQEELVNIISLLLLQSGNETIKNLICFGMISLLQHQDQLDQLRENLSLIDDAVEEILRYYTGLTFLTRRLTIKDVEINGQIIQTGEHLFALNESANRDEQVFTNPDQFDISRPPQHHLSFGYGTHQCIAMHLVRAQLKTVFMDIFQRLPNLKLDQSPDNIQYVSDSNKDIAVNKMIVTW